MSCSDAGNQSASQNGYLAEEFAAAKYCLEIDSLAEIDCFEPAVEVKSCQTVIRDESCSTFTRKGRFFLRIDQHNILKEKDGFYVFVLLQDRVVCDDRVLYPHELESILGAPVVKNRSVRYDLLFPEVTG